jgi:hypothetical protein
VELSQNESRHSETRIARAAEAIGFIPDSKTNRDPSLTMSGLDTSLGAPID